MIIKKYIIIFFVLLWVFDVFGLVGYMRYWGFLYYNNLLLIIANAVCSNSKNYNCLSVFFSNV